MRGGNERERGREQGASKTVILLFINGLGGMDSSLEVKALVYLRQRHELTSVGKCSTFQGIARDKAFTQQCRFNTFVGLGGVL